MALPCTQEIFEKIDDVERQRQVFEQANNMAIEITISIPQQVRNKITEVET